MPADAGRAFGNLFVVDRFASFMKLAGAARRSASRSCCRSTSSSANRSARFEFPVLMLFATLGMMVMISANDLISLYLGLELQILALYVRRRLPARPCARPRRG